MQGQTDSGTVFPLSLFMRQTQHSLQELCMFFCFEEAARLFLKGLFSCFYSHCVAVALFTNTYKPQLIALIHPPSLGILVNVGTK